MSGRYTWVQWNRYKGVYDLVLLAGVGSFIAAYIGVGVAATPASQSTSPPILLIRASGACAIVMLHLILAIGPLARLFPTRFAPLLYNRRHLGVATFAVSLAHGVVVLLWYGGFGVVGPITAILTANPRLDSFVGFPFEIFGVAALIILFLMAATSHDFWLHNLSPRWWKTLHMGVYVAYALLVMHVALGTIQAERSAAYPLLIGAGAAVLFALHVVVGWREVQRDRAAQTMPTVGWMDITSVHEIPQDRAKVVRIKSGDRCDRVAVFRHGEQGEKISAVASVCAHQGGPLGEGKIIDGCITCPWHGYQYLPETGQSPPPYAEQIPTYELRIEGDRVMLHPEPNPPGTPVEPAIIGGQRDA
jgi:nitrite reductase/ring-hydroxylating ferredoxin subunit